LLTHCFLQFLRCPKLLVRIFRVSNLRMKKLFFSLFLLFSAAFLYADDYEWEDYGLAFSLPEDFEVTQNDGEAFYAKGDAMEFGLFPWADEEVEKADIAAFTLAIASELELDELHDVSLLELNGLDGAYVEGSLNGVRVFLMGLIDGESDTNFFSLIKFYDDDEVAEEAAIEIATSICTY